MLASMSQGVFAPDVLQVCSKTVMDNTDPNIRFDEAGVCNWWHEFHAERAKQPDLAHRTQALKASIGEIKAAGQGQPFDSIIGLSGGVDSSYLAYLTKEWGLRPLVLHFDNGWNDTLAVRNIEVIVKALDLQLQTYVINWPEFRDLQRAYFKASVLDLEVPTDHVIFGALYETALKHGIKYILSGNNFATEWLLPSAWYYAKGDAVNIRAIHDQFGERSIKQLPIMSGWQRLYCDKVRSIQIIQSLDFIDYKKTEAKAFLMEAFGWQDYGGKHYESVFTRFFQGYILPKRYGIDKRKAHLSNLILNGEMTRDEAISELEKPTYDPDLQVSDKRYVAKKLGWSESEFESIVNLPPVPQESYGTNAAETQKVEYTTRCLQPFAKIGRTLLRV